MKQLSPKEITDFLNQLDNLIEHHVFDEAIKLGRNILKTRTLPDKISIEAIMERIRLARSLKDNPSSKTKQLTNPYNSNSYYLPKYQTFQEDDERKHLKSLIKYIEQDNLKNIKSISKNNKQSFRDKDTFALNHEEIIQIGIDKELAKKKLENQEKKLSFTSKAIKRPFFARFDFNDRDSKKIIYISDTNTNIFINSYGNVKYVDWRAPATKPYYTYRRPIKNVSFSTNNYDNKETKTGDIDLVAQYTIKKAEIKNYEYDSFNKKQVTDDEKNILQEKLNDNSSARMKAHADTLQTEQYRLTSYNPDEDLVIQGVAGSGKTVIALSRLAYLKYEENKNFSNENILYISPNAEFSEYVSDVSIGLGETRIPIKTIELVIDNVFKPKASTQSATHWEDFSTFAEKYNQKKSPSIKQKFTKSFLKKFYTLCEKLENDAATVQEYNSLIPKYKDLISDIDTKIKNKKGVLKSLKKEQADLEKLNKQLPTSIKRLRSKIAKKIEGGATDINLSLDELKSLEEDAKITKSSLKIVTKHIKETSLDIAKEHKSLEKIKQSHEQSKNKFIRKLKCYKLPKKNNSKKDNSDEQYAKTILPNKPYIKIGSDKIAKIVIPPEKLLSSICPEKTIKKFAYENFPYYIILKFLLERANGNNLENRSIKHVVVDEAQDYTEPYFYFLRQAFPNAVFTILGDKNQNVNPFFKHTSLENLIPDTKYAEINIAYRSSPEIVKYCNHILKLDNIRSARKSQGIDVLEKKVNSKNLIKTIEEEVEHFKKLGFKRISVITSNQARANTINTKLHHQNKLPIVLPVYKAKGLEYDAVIVINDYKKETKDLLYVACTRAKHALTVLKV